jgi:hypothetical protein
MYPLSCEHGTCSCHRAFELVRSSFIAAGIPCMRRKRRKSFNSTFHLEISRCLARIVAYFLQSPAVSNVTMHGSAYQSLYESRPLPGHLLAQPRESGSTLRLIWARTLRWCIKATSYGKFQGIDPVADCEVLAQLGSVVLEGAGFQHEAYRAAPTGRIALSVVPS